MKTSKMSIIALFSSFLTGCGMLGYYVSPYEIAQVSKNNTGLCFQITKPGDYYVHYLSIRDRNAPEMSGFNRLLPALKITSNQMCIPEAYYKFPENGEINVDIALHSPTKVMKRRNIVSEFRMVNGEPQPFTPREYSVPTADCMREKE
ncbi:putative T6SS immunity periplasmic lipoprotein [Erwinia rhapontici]|uniref:putative T6SS immunity periplasmic lipoprotein n=1 Tax=Erwinia rhapontici TaxID=55212 RepID=UPI001BB39DAF|nr:putative T6SS immunity periplasmic lipoprotein [Erwinia rhapontici]